jgi:hypothetical protein
MSDVLILNSRITINSSLVGKFQMSGVHEVHIVRSMHGLADSATITLPSIGSYIPVNGSVPVVVTTGTQFTDGDGVLIELAYNGGWQTEFSGFVKRRDLAMPLVVECEGYVRQLRLNVSVSADYTKKNTSAKALLQQACKGTDITVVCPVDFPLSGIRLVEADGVRICDYIKQASDNTLTVFFVQPTVLWCGLVYSAYAGKGVANPFGLQTVNYRLGFNCIKDNKLKERVPSEPVQIIMKGKYASAVQVYTASKAAYAKRKVQSLVNHVPDAVTMGKFAQEKEYQMNYTGYEGKLTGFLQPYASVGWDAYITDARYPELTGTYVVETVDVRFGVQGARRTLEMGPRVGFGS